MDKEKIIEILKRVIAKVNYLRGSNEIWLIYDLQEDVICELYDVIEEINKV